MSGIFTEFQPRYAEHRIATFPVSETKRPLTKYWPKVGLRGSAELASKFDGANAFGFLCGRRSNVTIVDVDTVDEKITEDAIRRHGEPGVVVRTASGKCHLLYRYNGERRRIRPWPGLPIDLLGDGGFAVAAPSKIATGSYEIVHGRLDDLDQLTPMVGLEIEATDPDPNPAAIGEPPRPRPISQGRRNNEIWRWCMRNAHLCDDRMELVDMARAYNDQHCTPPLTGEEILSTASSAWAITERGDNHFGQHGCYFRTDEIVSMLHDQDALILLAFLKAHNGPWATFMCANGLTEDLGWDRHRLADARRRLIELGYVIQVRRATQGHPALFQWAD
jgi:hypothetical protein